MTAETQTYSKNHDTLRIPSREEFHRYYGGNVHELEFCTCHPISFGIDGGSVIANKIASDLRRERKLYIDAIRNRENQIKVN